MAQDAAAVVPETARKGRAPSWPVPESTEHLSQRTNGNQEFQYYSRIFRGRDVRRPACRQTRHAA